MKRTRVLIAGLYGIENSGVRHVTAMLRERGGFDCDLLFFKDWRHNRVEWASDKEVELFVDLVARKGYSVVGLGFGSPYYRVAIQLTDALRARGPEVLVVWGGLHPTLVPEHCIAHADVVCVGEGEAPVLELVERFERGESYDDVGSLWVRHGETVVKNKVNELEQELDDLPFRHYGADPSDDSVSILDHDVLSAGDPMLKHREYRIFCSRGCPYKCAYCYNSSLRAIYPEGRGNYHRRRSVQNVMAELRQARARIPNLRWVKFDDDTFVFPKPWLLEFCAAYEKEFAGLPFDVMMTPEVATEDRLRPLKKAGLRGIQMGIEAGSDRESKEVYERNSTVKQILAFDKLNKELAFDVKYDVIIDNPMSWRSDKDALFHLLTDLESDFKVYLYSLTLYPKSSVTEKMIAAGLATEDDVEGIATKSFRQFRVSVDWPRSHEDKYFLGLTMLACKPFVPKKVKRWFRETPFWEKHPDLLLEVAQGVNLVRMTGIAAKMASRGELSLQKVREYGNVRKMINQ